MANKIPVFLNGSELVVEIGRVPVAVMQAISFQEAVSNQLAFGMGDYSALANDPLQIQAVQCNMRLLRYTKAAMALCGKTALDQRKFTNSVKQQYNNLSDSAVPEAQDGNSLVFTASWSPAALLLEATVDIKVYTRVSATDKRHTHTLHGCIANGWSIGFSVGAQASEDYSFICRMVQDLQAEPDKVNNGN